MLKNFLKIITPIAIGAIGITIINSCSIKIPEKAEPIKNFNADKYLGKWYEIARKDFKFEKDLNQTTANYSKNDDGSIKVVNRGYNYVKNEWKESIGEAKFIGSDKEARLKVSFFKPFWSGYNVVELDDNYKYALVVGKNLDYLWILSREKTIPNDVKDKFLKKAQNIGYDTSDLIWVEHK